jgi:Ras-related GTP-binding protein A/B
MIIYAIFFIQEGYFESQRDQIFRNVEVLIYVFDIESHERKHDAEHFNNCLSAIATNSPTAHIFCLIHKMDMIPKLEDRTRLFADRKAELEAMARPLIRTQVTCFGTSIWDETLYKVLCLVVVFVKPFLS